MQLLVSENYSEPFLLTFQLDLARMNEKNQLSVIRDDHVLDPAGMSNQSVYYEGFVCDLGTVQRSTKIND